MLRIIINKTAEVGTKSVVTIGNFDGLHLGHIQLFKELNQHLANELQAYKHPEN